ncbi:predicted protein [Uncinocarpus reesii 1704]|uniref:Uncharacterized protein n=1 Tax=Uncinocarpus reesii (strain UAMH 1704) TaxID=336963 RepID=C4JYM5_UNCRE|nr:uncharacterized protein UREG_07276 [Uncinocarpus reesii 1704]EEP82411.1 predicted protein [Uncinocarpus reesii 1704]
MISEVGFFRHSPTGGKGRIEKKFEAKGAERSVSRWNPKEKKLWLEGVSDDELEATNRAICDAEAAGDEIWVPPPVCDKLDRHPYILVPVFNRHTEGLDVKKPVPKDEPRRRIARRAGIEDKSYHIDKIRNERSIMKVTIEKLKKLMDSSKAPYLQMLDKQEFGIVGSFLLTGDYAPMLIEARGIRHPLDPYEPQPGSITHFLEGLITKKEYDSELIRSGKIYLRAHELNLPKLKVLVVRKLALGFQYLDEKLAIQLADSIFSVVGKEWDDKYGARYMVNEPLNGRYMREKEPMRAFLVDYFAHKLAVVSDITVDRRFRILLMKYPALRIGVYARAAELGLDRWSDPSAEAAEMRRIAERNKRAEARRNSKAPEKKSAPIPARRG